jgi:hypothetical protein
MGRGNRLVGALLSCRSALLTWEAADRQQVPRPQPSQRVPSKGLAHTVLPAQTATQRTLPYRDQPQKVSPRPSPGSSFQPPDRAQICQISRLGAMTNDSSSEPFRSQSMSRTRPLPQARYPV